MNYITLPTTDFKVSEIILGCMRIHETDPQKISKLIKTALEEGINFFDHADKYGNGMSEVKQLLLRE